MKKNNANKKLTILFLSLALIMMAAAAGTYALLTATTSPIENQFRPSDVACQVNENFTGTEKSNITVENTGSADEFVRVDLVTYRVNDKGQRIGGTATIPALTLGNDWFKGTDGFYYYKKPVAPGETTATALCSNAITLQTYDDADGGKQVIEVFAECIQSEPDKVVNNSWQVVSVDDNGNLY